MNKENIRQTVEARVRYTFMSLGLVGMALLTACGYSEDTDTAFDTTDIRPVAAPTPTFYGETPEGLAFPTDVPKTLAPTDTSTQNLVPTPVEVPSAPRP